VAFEFEKAAFGDGLAKVERHAHVNHAGDNAISQEISMTDPTTSTPPVPAPEGSINDNLATSSPSPRSTLIGIGCIVGFVVLYVVYYKTIGF
jgi:hypothetical protein